MKNVKNNLFMIVTFNLFLIIIMSLNLNYFSIFKYNDKLKNDIKVNIDNLNIDIKDKSNIIYTSNERKYKISFKDSNDNKVKVSYYIPSKYEDADKMNNVFLKKFNVYQWIYTIISIILVVIILFNVIKVIIKLANKNVW